MFGLHVDVKSLKDLVINHHSKMINHFIVLLVQLHTSINSYYCPEHRCRIICPFLWDIILLWQGLPIEAIIQHVGLIGLKLVASDSVLTILNIFSPSSAVSSEVHNHS
jgi:hypothetical protein